MRTSRLIVVAALAALPLSACSSEDPADLDPVVPESEMTEPAVPTSSDDPLAGQPVAPSDAPPEGPEPSNPDGIASLPDDPPPTAPAPDDERDGETGEGEQVPDETPSDDGQGDTSRAAPVVVAVDGQRVPLASVCNGADGAVMATTEGEVTYTLVREGGVLAVRYQAEGDTIESDDVTVDEHAAGTGYSATLSSDDVAAFDVLLDVGDVSDLPNC